VSTKSDSRRNHFLLFCVLPRSAFQIPMLLAFPTARLLFCHFTMDNITQQMNAVALSDNANKSDANDFNASLFKYLLFVTINAGTENIWSKANKELKAWMRKQNKLQSMACQTSDRIKVLNHVNFQWRIPQEVKWNLHYEELVEFHAANGHCSVHWTCHLGEWVKNQR
jgi:hypothetical protein